VLLLPSLSPKSTSELQTLLPGEDTHFSKVENKEFIPKVHTQLGCKGINKFLMLGIHHCLFIVGKLGSLFLSSFACDFIPQRLVTLDNIMAEGKILFPYCQHGIGCSTGSFLTLYSDWDCPLASMQVSLCLRLRCLLCTGTS
jgi:hypothetical protein